MNVRSATHKRKLGLLCANPSDSQERRAAAYQLPLLYQPLFRHELRRVLNRGEAVNAMKRSIDTGRIAPAQAKRPEETQAVADALNLLANVVMAWNTMQLQAVLGRLANRRQFIASELTGKIAPTRPEGINLRGIFRFPTERYAEQILPSQNLPKIVANA
ncbi:MAG: Tn3 family transposase [Casimicrobium sp.]|jgi:hypothetical protein